MRWRWSNIPIFVGMYASTEDGERRSQFDKLSHRLARLSKGYVVGGDLNNIIDNGEKEGGLPARRGVSRCFEIS